MPRPKSETVEGKPPYSYVSLCTLAIMNSPIKMVTLSQIYDFITDNFAYYRTTTNKWQNSLRHNLSYNQCFVKIPRGGGGKGNYWTLHERASDMFENGTAQRRKKRFKVEDESADGTGFKVGPETFGAGYPYSIPNIDAYFDLNTVLPNAPKLANDLVREHREWLKTRATLRENERSLDSSLLSNEEKEAESDNTAKILAYTIENLLKPDSPRRKKKVYRSTDCVENVSSGSSALDKKANKDKASCARKISTASNVSSPPAYASNPYFTDLLTPPKEEDHLQPYRSYNSPSLPQVPSYLPHPLPHYQSSRSHFTQAKLSSLMNLQGYGYGSSYPPGMMPMPTSYPSIPVYPPATGHHPYPLNMYPYNSSSLTGYPECPNQPLLLGS